MPLVTVIIPNYNHAPYLRQRIDSVLNQTFRDIEVIILDDCSQDHSRDIIREYRDDCRIRLAFNEINSGCVFKQWNKGLRMATGKYVWIAESDDYSDLEFLDRMVAAMESDPDVGLAFCESFRVVGDEVSLARERWFGRFAPCYVRDFAVSGDSYVASQMLYINTIPNASSAVFRRSVSEVAGAADETFHLSGDWLFWIKLLANSKLAYVATPLNYYRYHEQTARHKHESNGVMLEEAYRIAMHVLRDFPVSRDDARSIKNLLTGWFVESMISERDRIPSDRVRNITRLATCLNPLSLPRLWCQKSGLLWLWLGCRRRALTVLRRL